MTFTQQQCNNIASPAICTGLSYSGTNKSFPRAVLFDTKDQGGVDMTNLYANKLVDQVKLLLRHEGKKTITGKLLAVSLQPLSSVTVTK